MGRSAVLKRICQVKIHGCVVVFVLCCVRILAEEAMNWGGREEHLAVVNPVLDAEPGSVVSLRGSGLTDGDYHAAIAAGIRKVNYYTYGALAGGRAVYDVVKRIPEGLQFHDVAVAATDAISDDIKRVMGVLSGK